MKKNKYRYTLRLAIDKSIYNYEKKQDLIDFVKKSKVSDVAFFINQEELSDSHITLKKAQELITEIDTISQPLKEMNVTISLNPWTTMNHSDRGLGIRSELDIKPMVSYQGVLSTSMACPGYVGWMEYISDVYAIYASIKPHELWLEDDFRHYKNAPFELGCFCEDHMKKYNAIAHSDLTREEFIKKMFTGEKNKYRDAYLQVARDEILKAASMIEEKVHKVSPNTSMGLMSSWPEIHALENRDWHKLLEVLSGPNTPAVSRPHLPAYNEVSTLQYARDFEKYTVATRTLIGNKHKIYPELENYMYSQYAKSNRFTQFQLETSSSVRADGLLMNLFSMMGVGIDKTYKYDELLAQSKEFADFMYQNGISIEDRDGIIIPMTQKVAKYKIGDGTLHGLMASQTQWLELLAIFGFATRPLDYTDQKFVNETIALTGNFLNTLSNAQITEMIQDNFVLLDGDALIILDNRNLLNLINADSIEVIQPRTGKQVYEQFDGLTLSGVKDSRITLQTHVGAYVKVHYLSDMPKESNAYNRYNELVGPATVANDKFYIMPVGEHEKYGWEGEYIDFREKDLKKCLNVSYLVDMYNCKAIFSGRKIIVSNWSMDTTDGINFKLDKPVSKISITYRDGSKVKNQIIDVSSHNNIYHADFKVPGLAVVYVECLE
ncbi:hypothetical protein M5C72_02275 [Companilactobacillus allii]|uniref:Uncharacterized protein n=2 Tax=Companilactobacillus allii TaxID=1847728 RepID=A0A1P8Q2H4_9LACO|nr:hypothetical protein [Companilactobacillus allii]APX71989.1 hypothetical protein BTM29_05195 [Companilactobacillus allii]USQ69083.1 hypothetical protein M5C72_02275 [Companilactobacillus allii]